MPTNLCAVAGGGRKKSTPYFYPKDVLMEITGEKVLQEQVDTGRARSLGIRMELKRHFQTAINKPVVSPSAMMTNGSLRTNNFRSQTQYGSMVRVLQIHRRNSIRIS